MKILTLLTAFGLATGAGAKAFVPVLLLGLFHYTVWFDLSADYLWIAHPVVISILAVLVLIELWVDAHPDLGGASAIVGYLSKFVAGFIAVAAVVGQLDPEITELAGSGLLGGVTAITVHGARNAIRRPIRESAEIAHESVGKIFSAGEAATAATISAAAILSPFAGLAAIALAIVSGVLLWRIGTRRSPCGACGAMIRSQALVCPSCGARTAW